MRSREINIENLVARHEGGWWDIHSIDVINGRVEIERNGVVKFVDSSEIKVEEMIPNNMEV